MKWQPMKDINKTDIKKKGYNVLIGAFRKEEGLTEDWWIEAYWHRNGWRHNEIDYHANAFTHFMIIESPRLIKRT